MNSEPRSPDQGPQASSSDAERAAQPQEKPKIKLGSRTPAEEAQARAKFRALRENAKEAVAQEQAAAAAKEKEAPVSGAGSSTDGVKPAAEVAPSDKPEKQIPGTPPNQKQRRIIILILLLVVIGVGTYLGFSGRGHGMVLTGIVTTDEVIVSSEIQGRLQQLKVHQGDTVKRDDLLALIQPKEWQADMAFYNSTEKQSAAQVNEARADLKYQEAQTSNQIRQAEANLAAAESQVIQAQADEENARLTFQRMEGLYHQGVEDVQSYDQARTTFDAAKAHVESLHKQVLAAEAAVALAQAATNQTALRRAALQASTDQLSAAAAQKTKAKVHLDYTEIHAPIDGTVDVRAALEGEVVNPGQAIVTLINPDDLWVRADVEEGYIDRIRIDDKLPVRLPSGAVLEGTVFYRARDADYATQRDVSRTKRDIKTFEIRLRCDNTNRALAVGMSAYVTLPFAK